MRKFATVFFKLQSFFSFLAPSYPQLVYYKDPNYTVCLHTKLKQQHEVTFHTNLFCSHFVPKIFFRDTFEETLFVQNYLTNTMKIFLKNKQI
jgi:hypothetical protein